MVPPPNHQLFFMHCYKLQPLSQSQQFNAGQDIEQHVQTPIAPIGVAINRSFLPPSTPPTPPNKFSRMGRATTPPKSYLRLATHHTTQHDTQEQENEERLDQHQSTINMMGYKLRLPFLELHHQPCLFSKQRPLPSIPEHLPLCTMDTTNDGATFVIRNIVHDLIVVLEENEEKRPPPEQNDMHEQHELPIPIITDWHTSHKTSSSLTYANVCRVTFDPQFDQKRNFIEYPFDVAKYGENAVMQNMQKVIGELQNDHGLEIMEIDDTNDIVLPRLKNDKDTATKVQNSSSNGSNGNSNSNSNGNSNGTTTTTATNSCSPPVPPSPRPPPTHTTTKKRKRVAPPLIMIEPVLRDKTPSFFEEHKDIVASLFGGGKPMTASKFPPVDTQHEELAHVLQHLINPSATRPFPLPYFVKTVGNTIH